MANVDDLFGSDVEESDQEQQAPTGDLSRPSQEPAYDGAELEDDLGDDEPGGQGTAVDTTKDLFGSDDEDDDGQGAKRGGRLGPAEPQSQQPKGRLEEAVVPLLPVPALGSVCLLRTTNIVGIQPQPFEPSTHELEEETFLDESGRHRVKLATNAIIRWRVRQLPDGREVRESNARFVRWEDGSMQLLLGDEVLDVADQDMASTYLFCTRPGIFQGHGHIARKLALRPASLDSGLHKRLREAVDKRHVKQFKVASHGGLQNPELEKARREAAEEERIKDREALQRKQDRVMARAYGGGGRRTARNPRFTKDYPEDDQEWDGEARGYDDGYDDDGLTADQRARLSLARTHGMPDEEGGRRGAAAKRGGPRSGGPAAKRRRGAAGGGGSEEEEEEDEEEEDADFDEDEEEPEYEFSGEEEEGDAEDEGRGKGGRKEGRRPSATPPPPPTAPAAAGAGAAADNRSKARHRRGVVVSDDEDE